MRNIKKIIALALALLLMLTLCTGCGAGSLLVGTWTDSTQTLTMAFSKDGSAIVTAYGIPLEVTYTYEGDTLTILYSENITDEFCWEKPDENGELYQDYYTRTA